MGTTNGKVPGRVKYTFAFGALGKDLIYGMMATFAMIYWLHMELRSFFVGKCQYPPRKEVRIRNRF